MTLVNTLQGFTLLLIDSPFQNCLTPTGLQLLLLGVFLLGESWSLVLQRLGKGIALEIWRSPDTRAPGGGGCPANLLPDVLSLVAQHVCASLCHIPAAPDFRAKLLPFAPHFLPLNDFLHTLSPAPSRYWGLRTHLVSAARMASMQRTVSGRIKNICMFLSWREYVGSGDDGCAVRLETAAKSVFLHEMCWLIHHTVSSRSHSCVNWRAVRA